MRSTPSKRAGEGEIESIDGADHARDLVQKYATKPSQVVQPQTIQGVLDSSLTSLNASKNVLNGKIQVGIAKDVSVMLLEKSSEESTLRVFFPKDKYSIRDIEGMIASVLNRPLSAVKMVGGVSEHSKTVESIVHKEPHAEVIKGTQGKKSIPQGDIFPCPDCSRVFEKKRGLKQHQARKHKRGCEEPSANLPEKKLNGDGGRCENSQNSTTKNTILTAKGKNYGQASSQHDHKSRKIKTTLSNFSMKGARADSPH